MVTVTLTPQEAEALAYLIANTSHCDLERGEGCGPGAVRKFLDGLDPMWAENCRVGNMLADRILPFFKGEED